MSVAVMINTVTAYLVFVARNTPKFVSPKIDFQHQIATTGKDPKDFR